MESFRTVREKIIRSKLAQLASLSKDTKESESGIVESSTSDYKQRVETELITNSQEPQEKEAADRLPLVLHNHLLHVSELKNITRKLEKTKEAKPSDVFVFRMQISNIKDLINSGNAVPNAVYVPELDSCLRYGAFFPNVIPINKQIIELFIDMCQVGRDARLPDFLQTSAKIGIVNQSNGSEEIVGSEEGLFHLPKYREFGWFELASVPIDWPEILRNERFSILNDAIAVTFTVSVFKSLIAKKGRKHNFGATNSDTESSGSDSSDTEDDNDVAALTEVNMPVMSDSFCFPVTEFSMCENTDVICVSDEWPVEFLGQSIKAVLAFGCDSTLDIFLDYFHGVAVTLPEIAMFKCRVSLLHPVNKKNMVVFGENDHVFHLNDEGASHWLNNHVCSVVDSRLIIDQSFIVDNTVTLRFDFYPLD